MSEPGRDDVKLIFPVGHDMGAVYRVRPSPHAYLEREYEPAVPRSVDPMGAPRPRPLRVEVELDDHRVRVARRSVRLSGEEVAIWRLAHGPASGAENRLWTRTVLDEQARAVGHRRPGRLIDGLLERGVLAEASPARADAVAFARRHRLCPLMVGFGDTAERPSSFGLGYSDEPVVELSGDLYRLWQLSPRSDLWAACELLAGTAATAAPAERESSHSTKTERVLTRVLGALHFLLSHHVVYLDEAVGDR
ncbi:hypothetical protein [Spirillospora sp. NPDC048819]|uniref:hypothetical protein n=1 Tax=Spirillospora sp. NPDC048819 TaxID=3155268 RepID=UPI0033FEABE8